MHAIKQWYIGIVEGRSRTVPARLFWFFLLPLSWLYGTGVLLRNILFDSRVLPSYRSRARIISVGNITWGGTAKTSLVIRLAEHLLVRGPVAVICRGYSHDEPKLIQAYFSGKVNVFQNKDRVSLVKQIESRYETIIVDDGFQYRYLEPSCSIVLINAAADHPEYVLPAGIYREPFDRIRRADVIMLTSTDLSQPEVLTVLKERISRCAPRKPVYKAHYRLQGFMNAFGAPVTLETLQQSRCALLTSIAFPEGVRQKIRHAGITVQKEFIFPDHHIFSGTDISAICKQVARGQIRQVIISSKDLMRLKLYAADLPLVVMNVTLAIENEGEFFKSIDL